MKRSGRKCALGDSMRKTAFDWPRSVSRLMWRLRDRAAREVEEALPRRSEDGAVLRIGDFDDDAPAGLCRTPLRELPVRAGRTVVGLRRGMVELQRRPREHGGRCGGGP